MRLALPIFVGLVLFSAEAGAQLLHGVTDSLSGGGSAVFLSLSCPAGGLVSVPSTNFTVTYIGGTFNGTTNTVSMSDASTGTFTPTSPATPAAGASFTFTYTPPATPGTYTISVSDNIVRPVVPSSCNYVASGSVSQNPLPLVIP